jgi:hypothetical protein
MMPQIKRKAEVTTVNQYPAVMPDRFELSKDYWPHGMSPSPSKVELFDCGGGNAE